MTFEIFVFNISVDYLKEVKEVMKEGEEEKDFWLNLVLLFFFVQQSFSALFGPGS